MCTPKLFQFHVSQVVFGDRSLDKPHIVPGQDNNLILLRDWVSEDGFRPVREETLFDILKVWYIKFYKHHQPT